MKKKLEHIWYYYKWYILAAALVLLVAANFIGELGSGVSRTAWSAL